MCFFPASSSLQTLISLFAIEDEAKSQAQEPQTPYSKFELAEEIIGLMVSNANGLASSGFDSKFAYTTGCVVLVSNVDLGTQSHFVVSNRLSKPLRCVVGLKMEVTLQLVTRQPSESQPSSGSSPNTIANGSKTGQDVNAPGSRPRVNHVSLCSTWVLRWWGQNVGGVSS